MTKQQTKFKQTKINVRGLDKRANTLDGMPIVNATKSIRLVIGDDDIKGSRSKQPDRCVAAKACMRQMKATEARVHLGKTYVRVKDKWVRYTTSPALKQEIVAFDRGGSFEAGTYMLYKIVPSLLKGGKQSADTPRKKKRGSVNRYAFVSNVRQDVVHAD